MTSVAPTAVRISVILLAVAGVVGHLAYLDALWWHTLGLAETMARGVRPATLMLLSAHAIVSLVCAALSILLVLHDRQRAQAARALGTAFAAWSYLMAYSGVTMLFRPDPGMTREIFEGHFLFVEVIGLAGLIRFTSLFPRTLSAEEMEPSATLPAVLTPFHSAAVFMRRRFAPWSLGALVLIALWSWAMAADGNISDSGLSPMMDLVRFCAAGLVVINLRQGWAAATEGDRDSLMWLTAGLSLLLASLAVLIGGNVLVAVTGFPEPDVAWRPILLDVGMIGFLVALSMSVLYRGPIDPAQVTQRVAAMATVITLGLFLAAGLEVLLAGGILAAFSVRAGVGTALAFAVILSTYRGLSSLIERLMPAD